MFGDPAANPKCWPTWRLGDQSSINQHDVNGIRLNVPLLGLQQVFARRMAEVATLKAAHRHSLAEMDALFASLQHRAFRGEL